jgi:hypothetical protein
VLNFIFAQRVNEKSETALSGFANAISDISYGVREVLGKTNK